MLRNTPTSKRMPSTRPSGIEWLDTSAVATSIPCSRMTARRACSCGASGVVSVEATGMPPMRVPIEPITPQCAAPTAASTMNVVEVLPCVPVIPIVLTARAGLS